SMGIGVKGACRGNENREFSDSRASFSSKIRQISKLGARPPHPYIYAGSLSWCTRTRHSINRRNYGELPFLTREVHCWNGACFLEYVQHQTRLLRVGILALLVLLLTQARAPASVEDDRRSVPEPAERHVSANLDFFMSGLLGPAAKSVNVPGNIRR